MPKKSLVNLKKKYLENKFQSKELDFIVHTIIEIMGKAISKILLFGSHIAQSATSRSDIDIALEGKEPLDLAKVGRIKEIFEESDLPYTVDLIDLNRVSSTFRKNVLRNGIILY